MRPTSEQRISSQLARQTEAIPRAGVTSFSDANRWTRHCAVGGTAAWAALAVTARLGFVRIGAIELMFAFAPLVIVPLGMEVGRRIAGAGWLEQTARCSQPFAAALAVAALLLPPGSSAGFLAGGWMIVCFLMAGAAANRLRSFSGSGTDKVIQTAICVAGLDLAVGGAWFVASRLGLRPMGIQEPIGLLTAVHFHFAGFATSTIAAATLHFARRRGPQRWFSALVMLVVTMPFVVAAGFVISPALKMAAGLVFSASIAVLAVAMSSFAKQLEDVLARRLLQFAAASIFAGMILSGTCAIADFAGSDVLTIPQMARTHGLLNAFGFCLVGLLGWLIEGSEATK